jgi:hypothetical protein
MNQWRPRKYSREPVEPLRNKKGDIVLDKHGNPVDMRTDEQRREDTEDYRKWLFLREKDHAFINMKNYDAMTGVPSEQEYFRWKKTGLWDQKDGIIQEPLNIEYWHKIMVQDKF